MEWVLLIFMTTTNTEQIHTERFNTKEACDYAREYFEPMKEIKTFRGICVRDIKH